MGHSNVKRVHLVALSALVDVLHPDQGLDHEHMCCMARRNTAVHTRQGARGRGAPDGLVRLRGNPKWKHDAAADGHEPGKNLRCTSRPVLQESAMAS
jgi:hypothetical protein